MSAPLRWVDVDPDRGHPSGDIQAQLAAADPWVASWPAFLRELAARFRELREETRDLLIQHAVERAAAGLLPIVMLHTGTNEAWYDTYSLVVTWYLEFAGYNADRVRERVERVVSERFSSWLAPSGAAEQEVYAALGELARDASGLPLLGLDATAAWLGVRDAAFRACLEHGLTAKTRPAPEDGHQAHIYGPERDRDPSRAQRMIVALEACRLSASRGEPLTFARLSSWQAVVLGGPPPAFRTADAFAKEGRERYPCTPDLAARFDEVLAQAADSYPPVLRAARAYLDVCFFHPFADGNGRAARLALDHVLTAAGLRITGFRTGVLLSRAADDFRGTVHFALLIDELCGAVPTARAFAEGTVEALIRRAADQAHERMVAAFIAAGAVPVPGSDLDQAGLLDGRDIVVDYLQHGEPGVAWEHLVYMVLAPPLRLSRELLRMIVDAGRELGMPAKTWEPLECLAE